MTKREQCDWKSDLFGQAHVLEKTTARRDKRGFQSALPVQSCVRTPEPPLSGLYTGLSRVVVLHLLWTSINKMVNWQDPALLLNEYCTSRGLFVSQYGP